MTKLHLPIALSAVVLAAISITALGGNTPPPGPPPAAPHLKIATVDMQELFKQYYKTNEAQKQINVERARIQKDNNERMAKIRDIETSLGNLRKQLDDPATAESRKQTVFKDWQMQQQEGMALDRERREFLQRRNSMLNEKMMQRMKGILEEIRKLVEEHAKREDFDYVFDKSGLSTSQVPVLLYTKDATDITTVLLKDLNKDAPADTLPDTSEKSPSLPASITPPTEDSIILKGPETRTRTIPSELEKPTPKTPDSHQK